METQRFHVLPDTNILMNNARTIETLIKKGFCLVVPVTVLAELDKYKYSKEFSYNVREAARMIELADKRNDGSVILTNKHKEISGLDLKKGDDRILSAAYCLLEEGNLVAILSQDRLVRLKAKGLGIPAVMSIEEINSILAPKLSKGEVAAGLSISAPAKKEIELGISTKPTESVQGYSKPSQAIRNYDWGVTTFEHKRKIFGSFPALTEQVGKDGRVSYNFLGSRRQKKQIARELTHTGNGYIYGAYLPEFKDRVDARGWISIKDCSEKELRELICKVIESFR